jgi:hypothetical protein
VVRSSRIEAIRVGVGPVTSRRRSETQPLDLERLARLHTEGLLDEAEFTAAKAQVLAQLSRTTTA